MKSRDLLSMMGALAFVSVLSGSGCSESDNSSSQYAAQLKAELDAKQKELDCKMAALRISCTSGDTSCESSKASSLAACGSSYSGSSGTTVTATETSVTTVTAATTVTTVTSAN